MMWLDEKQVIQDLENRLSEVFDSITNGLISKPYTDVRTVLQEAQNVYQVDLQEAVEGETKELRRKLDNQKRYIDRLRNKVREIHRSAAELRDRLAFYAEPANYEFDEVTQGSSAVERDKGKIAREALGIEEPDPNKVIRDALEYLAKMKHSSPAGHLAKDALDALDKLSDDR